MGTGRTPRGDVGARRPASHYLSYAASRKIIECRSMNTLLELKNIRHAYGQQTVVEDLSLTLKKGAIGCLLGPSGCGKTTVLRSIAGFEPISAGEIWLNGVVISSPSFCLPPEQRH